MCKKSFKSNEVNEINYNFIISNLILSKNENFTYNDIINDVKDMFTEINEIIVSVVEKCLIRLREDGFLSVLGSRYSVIEASI